MGFLWRVLKKKREKDTSSLTVLSIGKCPKSKSAVPVLKIRLWFPKVIKGHGVLECKDCGIIWNKDINTAKSMLITSLSI
jgi:hypothetical protein